jgi:multiple sugar transport system permease protein
LLQPTTIPTIAAVAPRRSGWARGGDGRPALLFLSPTLIVFSVFVLFPVVFSFYLSFHEWNMFSGESAFVGLDNYLRMASDPEFWQVFGNTAVYTVATVPLNMAVALGVAAVLNKKIVGKKILRAAFFTPVIISTVAAAVIWRWVFDPNLGLANFALESLGLPAVNWMSDPTAAMVSLVIVGTWKTFGVNMILFSAGLAAIPERYYEAARIDGAGRMARFWHITLPLLSPTTLFVLVLSIIGSFQVFDLVYVLTYGGPLGSTKVLVFYLYEHAFRLFDMGYASAVAYVLFAVLFVLTLIQIRIFRRRGHEAV